MIIHRIGMYLLPLWAGYTVCLGYLVSKHLTSLGEMKQLCNTKIQTKERSSDHSNKSEFRDETLE